MSTWHSTKNGITVYHNNRNCTEGNNIESENLKTGTGNKNLCSKCKKLNVK